MTVMIGNSAKADVVHTDFLKFVAEINKGSSVADLSIGLEEMVKAVKATGLPAELTYKIKVAPFGNTEAGEISQVWVDDKVAVKLPTKKRKGSLFFPTAKNTLSRMDPNQRDFIEEQAAAKTAQV
jgi:hypothetical protein